MGLAYNNPVTLTVVSSGSTSSTRSFSIKVTQLECSSLNRGEFTIQGTPLQLGKTVVTLVACFITL